MRPPSTPLPAPRAAGTPRTPRPRSTWSRRCPARRCCGAPDPTPAAGRPCGGPCHTARGIVVRIGLGRPVKRMLQGTDRVEPLDTEGGTSLHGTHRPLLANLRVDEAAALPITDGCVVRPARAVLRPPPTPSRLAAHFPAHHRL